LIESNQDAGYHSLEWNARDAEGQPVASGVYLIKLEAGAFSDSAKVTLAR
jgi:flagellar hook assembly protein FlgD